MTREIPPWLISDAATYEALRARARVLQALLLQSGDPVAPSEAVREELCRVRALTTGVDGFRRDDVVMHLESIELRIRELSHVAG